MIIDIHGLTIRCETDDDALLADLLRPYKFFQKAGGDHAITVIVREEPFSYDRLPPLEAQFSTPRNVVYRSKDLKVVDYFGRGVILQEAHSSTYSLFSPDRNLLCEAFYLLVLSLFGQFCDRVGLLRVHALAVSCNGKALLVMMPSGGGKSTLALALLADSPIKLISDDDPIVTPEGQILPFPRALGVLDRASVHYVPDHHVYAVDRMEFGRKYFVDCDFWEDKIERAPVDESILFVTRRVLNGTPAIRRAPKRAALGTLMRDAVFGVGLYQGIEFLFSHSTWEVLTKGTIVFKRFLRAVRLAASSEIYSFTLTGDVAQTTRVFKDFIDNLE